MNVKLLQPINGSFETFRGCRLAFRNVELKSALSTIYLDIVFFQVVTEVLHSMRDMENTLRNKSLIFFPGLSTLHMPNRSIFFTK